MNIITLDAATNVVVSLGTQGPQGAPGISEENMVYAKEIDFITDSLIYRGEASPGTLKSAAGWRIRKIVIGTGGDVSEIWASGNADFDKVWDNRASLTYIHT